MTATATATATRVLWFADSRVEIRLSRHDGDGGLSLIEMTAPPSAMPPLHVHDEDETFVVLEGSATIFPGDAVIPVSRGSVVTAPKDVPHTFRTGPDGVRWIVATSPGRFEGFVREAGRSAGGPGLPPAFEPTPEEFGEFARIAAENGIELLGPPGMLPTDL